MKAERSDLDSHYNTPKNQRITNPQQLKQLDEIAKYLSEKKKTQESKQKSPAA